MTDAGHRLLDVILRNAMKGKTEVAAANLFPLADRIAKTARDISEKDHVLSLEIYAGADFKAAAEAAFDLQTLSGLTTRFRFNGVEVSLAIA